MNNIENKIEKCAYKQMLEKGNRLYINLSFKTNQRKTIGCYVCSGDMPYHTHKRCYQTFDSIENEGKKKK